MGYITKGECVTIVSEQCTSHVLVNTALLTTTATVAMSWTDIAKYGKTTYLTSSINGIY
jgi:hypothetical protein